MAHATILRAARPGLGSRSVLAPVVRMTDEPGNRPLPLGGRGQRGQGQLGAHARPWRC